MNITAAQLRRAADLKDKIEQLQSELDSVLVGNSEYNATSKRRGRPPGGERRKIDPAARARIAASARARWVKAKATVKNRL
jgi:hypothetical protein